MSDQDELSEALDRVEIIEGSIAEAEFHKDHKAKVRLTAQLDQARRTKRQRPAAPTRKLRGVLT